MCCKGDKIRYHCKLETNSWIISLKVKHLVPNGLLLYAGNKLYLHKKRKSLLIANINHNLKDSVAQGTVSEPKCCFQH